MRSALVIGTGLIGTSAGLALSAQGVTVHLRDIDPASALTAASLGAGTVEAPAEVVDLAILAVPPALVGGVLAAAHAEGVARQNTDVASEKAEPRNDAVALDCETSRYIGGHPMAGAERNGPLAARADLFEGCTWVLTPTRDTETETLNTALETVALCGAVPVVMDAAAHDRGVGQVSHMPHIMASLVAARLNGADDRALSLAGPGVRDVTRIAAANPSLWMDILSANALVVADLLEEVAGDLGSAIAGLREMTSADEGKRREGRAAVENLLELGRAGRARISGKHGARTAPFEVVVVRIGDQAGELAGLLTCAGRAGVNIEDVRIEHSDGRGDGLAHLSVTQGSARTLREAIEAAGWRQR